MPNILQQSEIDELGAFLIIQLTEQLRRAGKVASKGLINSFKFDTTVTDSFIELSVSAADYAKFVDQGVKGNRSSARAPKSPYQFRKKFPSGEFITSLVGWIRRKGIDSGNKKVRDLAFAIGISVMRNGIKPTDFINQALKAAESRINNRMSEMIVKNVDVRIDRIIKGVKL
jgi:hypothetical protein